LLHSASVYLRQLAAFVLQAKPFSTVRSTFITWRARGDSNAQPADSKSDALSVELRAQVIVIFKLLHCHICTKNQNVPKMCQNYYRTAEP
jgi:hypothetical protein